MRKLLFILLLLPFISKAQVKTKLYIGGPLATNVYRGPLGSDSGLYVGAGCGNPNTLIPASELHEYYLVYRGAFIFKDTCDDEVWTSNPDETWTKLAKGDAITNITGLIEAGQYISITGNGTSGNPYIINAEDSNAFHTTTQIDDTSFTINRLDNTRDTIVIEGVSTGGGGGGGSVVSFSAGNLSPLFTTNVTNSTTNPNLTFSLSSVAPYTFYGRASGAGVPSFISGMDSNWIPTLHSENYYNTKYVPLTRTLTINGITYDLSTNRTWTIATGEIFPYLPNHLSNDSIYQHFNVLAYGAYGDGEINVPGMSITTGTATLTCSGNLFAATDVGKTVFIYGAGTAGGNFKTTIANYVSPTQVTLSTTASSTVSNVSMIWGHDDNVAIQNAINAAFANHGGIVYFPFTGGTYLLGGNFTGQDSSQLVVPWSDTTNASNFKHIVLQGETPPSFFTDWGFTSGEPHLNVTLLSINTQATTKGSIIASDSIGVVNHRNFTEITLQNMWLRVHSKNGQTHIAPVMSGINFDNIEMMHLINVRVDTESPGDSSVQPTNVCYGVKTPLLNNWGQISMDYVLIQNFKVGLTVNEHLNGNNVTIAMCDTAMSLRGTGYHLSKFFSVRSWWNKHHVVLNGTTHFDFVTLDFEDYNPASNPSAGPSRWYNTIEDILENSGSSTGKINYQRTIAVVAIHNQLILGTANSGVQIQRVGEVGAFVTSTNLAGNYNYSITNLSGAATARTSITLANNHNWGVEIGKLSNAMTLGPLGVGDGYIMNHNTGTGFGDGTGNLKIYNRIGRVAVSAGYNTTTDYQRWDSSGSVSFPGTNTAAGTTGAQTINKTTGTVNFAAGATTLVVTNSLATATSIIMITVYGTDATATSARVTRASGSFTITLNAAATAETTVGFVVFNNF